MSKLILVRGLPGSGKSTYAKSLGIFHIEADMFFMKDGEYHFDGKQIKDAHNWCFTQAETAMKLGMDVAVSNTFTQKWEMAKYIELANTLNYEVKIIEMKDNFGNVHGIGEDILQKMRNRWENV